MKKDFTNFSNIESVKLVFEEKDKETRWAKKVDPETELYNYEMLKSLTAENRIKKFGTLS